MQTSWWPELNADISRLGFGGMRFPQTPDGKIDREKSKEMLLYAWKNGVNYFDTAYRYHEGESQEFMGEVLAELPRDKLFFANKLPIWLVNEPADTSRLLSEQLAAARTEYFDFYLVHAMDAPRLKIMRDNGVYEALRKEQAAGRIRLLGFSYHGDWETFKEMIAGYKWDFVQIQINYLDDTLSNAADYFELLREKNIPCITMEPVRGGFLARPPQSALDELLAGQNAAYSPAQWALRWCMSKPEMRVILSGMSAMEQVVENVALFGDPKAPLLTEQDHAMLQRVVERILEYKTVPCTACRYCMDCPSGVDIPAVFEVYNNHKLFQSGFETWRDYSALAQKNQSAAACTSCGVCAPMCPQGIDIPAQMAEVHKVLAPFLEG